MKTKDRRKSYNRIVSKSTVANYHYVPGWFYGAHLDHIISKQTGFKHDIDPQVMGSLVNLRFITADQNIEKGTRVTSDSLSIMRIIGRSDLADHYEPRIIDAPRRPRSPETDYV